jgi:hypothetical protein
MLTMNRSRSGVGCGPTRLALIKTLRNERTNLFRSYFYLRYFSGDLIKEEQDYDRSPTPSRDKGLESLQLGGGTSRKRVANVAGRGWQKTDPYDMGYQRGVVRWLQDARQVGGHP